MLLDDERHVIKWLSQYGALTKTQVIRLLRDKTPETAEKILRNLKATAQTQTANIKSAKMLTRRISFVLLITASITLQFLLS